MTINLLRVKVRIESCCNSKSLVLRNSFVIWNRGQIDVPQKCMSAIGCCYSLEYLLEHLVVFLKDHLPRMQ